MDSSWSLFLPLNFPTSQKQHLDKILFADVKNQSINYPKVSSKLGVTNLYWYDNNKYYVNYM